MPCDLITHGLGFARTPRRQRGEESPKTAKQSLSLDGNKEGETAGTLTDDAVVTIREHKRYRDFNSPEENIEARCEDHCHEQKETHQQHDANPRVAIRLTRRRDITLAKEDKPLAVGNVHRGVSGVPNETQLISLARPHSS